MASEELLEWCSRHGVVWHGIQSGFVAEGWRGVLATQDLAAGGEPPCCRVTARPPTCLVTSKRHMTPASISLAESRHLRACFTYPRPPYDEKRGAQQSGCSMTFLPRRVATCPAAIENDLVLTSRCRHLCPAGAGAAAAHRAVSPARPAAAGGA